MDTYSFIKLAVSGNITPIQFVNTAAPAGSATAGAGSATPTGEAVTDAANEQMQQEADAAKKVQDQQLQQTDQQHQLDMALKSLDLRKKEAEINAPPAQGETAYLKGVQRNVGRTSKRAQGLVKKLFAQQFKSASFLDSVTDKITGFDSHSKAMALPMPKAERDALTTSSWDSAQGKMVRAPATAPDSDPNNWNFRGQMPGRLGDAIRGAAAGWNPFGAPETQAQMAARMAAESQPLTQYEPGSAAGAFAGVSRGLHNLLGSFQRGARNVGNGIAQQAASTVALPASLIAEGTANFMESGNVADEYLARNPGKTWADAPHQGGVLAGPLKALAGGLGGYLTARTPMRVLAPMTAAMGLNSAFRQPAETRLGLPAKQEMAPPPFVSLVDNGVAKAADSSLNLTSMLQEFFSRYGSAGQLPNQRYGYSDLPGVAYLAGAR